MVINNMKICRLCHLKKKGKHFKSKNSYDGKGRCLAGDDSVCGQCNEEIKQAERKAKRELKLLNKPIKEPKPEPKKRGRKPQTITEADIIRKLTQTH